MTGPQPYPPLRAVLRRYATPDFGKRSVRAVAADIVESDRRFEPSSLAFVELMRPGRPAVLPEPPEPTTTKWLTDDLVGLMSRPMDVLRLRAGERTLTFTQRFGHVEHDPRSHAAVRIDDTTLSSRAIKRDTEPGNGFMRRFNANLGALCVDGALMMVRSGRSDTRERVEELLLFGASHVSSDTTGPAFDHRPVIISSLDSAEVKNFLTQALRGVSEGAYFRELELAVQRLFEGTDVITRRLADGRCVRIHRPQVLQLPLSCWARVPHTLLAARAHNVGAAQALFQTLAHRWSREPGVVGHVGARMLACGEPLGRQAFLRHCWGIAQGLTRRQRLALEYLSLVLVGHDSRGDAYLAPHDPAVELLLLRHLMAEAGLSPYVQCLSGADRTLTMVSAFTAAHTWEARHRVTFDPRDLADDAYWSLFRQAAGTLGYSTIRSVRGVSGTVKWSLGDRLLSHPVPAHAYRRNR